MGPYPPTPGLTSQPPSPTDGTALPWILEHMMMYPSSSELPLRTMYTLNSINSTAGARPPLAPGARQVSNFAFSRDQSGRASPQPTSATSRKENMQSPAAVTNTAARFRAHMMSQIAQLPQQPASLPPAFISSFVRRCFPPELEEVDFPQALTALDYLKDLETRRKHDLEAALKKLDYPEDEEKRAELKKRYPGVDAWITEIKRKELVAGALYTQVYIRLRQWTLLNEMLLEPLNKANCIAMLNTLFPPHFTGPLPTTHLNHELLRDIRMDYFGHICNVEEKGREVLYDVLTREKRKGDENAWPVAQDYIERYIRAANEIIDKCFEVNCRDSLEDQSKAWQPKGRKVDSGISFGSTDRPSTSSSAGSNSKASLNKPLPPSPGRKESSSKPGGSTLERIAKEIRKMRSRADFSDAIVAKEPKQQKNRDSGGSGASRTLKKMKSAGFLHERHKNHSANSSTEGFDVDQFKRQRMIWEANNAAKTTDAANKST
ncbi:hypothetical protein AJ80_04437 [Polytolypa hystricis UAMH7299]|uniref:Uncharacterized protein n=1 Tax=Polytolypa hystricis (strain UAMH7299) TaxID=1447883 RepID=A0A2B7YC74_POLH7|nr:hypothetical protein AJ80_04437 [Polytolypa hystricis UAMH7299]